MTVTNYLAMLGNLACPCCGSALDSRDNGVYCDSSTCEHGDRPFLTAGDQPVLVDFNNSIFTPTTYRNGTTPISVPLGRHGRFLDRAREFLYGRNLVAATKASEVAVRLQGLPSPRILVIGGGTEGSGAASLYNEGRNEIVGLDVFPSSMTTIVADAHRLPFQSGTFDAVWIQAVLEHVLEPQVVVAEIHRVLKPGGLIYADTPFMQQVHAGAYDFQRFTASGHRWLFRHFSQIDAGSVGGPAVTLIWSIRYFIRGLGVPDRYASILTLPLFWLRIFDRLMRRRPALDGACGLYFFGARAETPILATDMLAYYERQATSHSARPATAQGKRPVYAAAPAIRRESPMD